MMSSESPRSRRVTVRRKALMLSCATLAMATAALAPQKAHAQAFNGTMSSTPGATQNITGPNSETITISSGTVTIDWAPNEVCCGLIDFLPNGNTATFTSVGGLTDYTVLNRVVPTLDPTRAISLNGHVLSTLEGGSTTGGNIWFFSPGGILIGGTAVFDVGGLLLTTNPVTFSTDSNGFTATFTAGLPDADIQVATGAQINALQQNSYVAIVAPRIEQGGNVQVNGSAAT